MDKTLTSRCMRDGMPYAISMVEYVSLAILARAVELSFMLRL
jgi:hypothetical protein